MLHACEVFFVPRFRRKKFTDDGGAFSPTEALRAQQQQLAAFRLAPHVVATDSDGPGSRAPMLWPRQSYAGCRWRRSTRQATVRGRMSYEYQNDPSARRAIERGFKPDGCSGVMCTVGCMAGYLSWIWLMAMARRGGGVCLFS